MEIIRAEKMGFCLGVEQAVQLAKEVAEKNKDKNIFILGELVHNKVVIKELEKLNIKTIDEESFVKGAYVFKENDLVILRAHGSTKEIYEKLLSQRVEIYDAACIFVKRIRDLLLKKLKEKYEIIFIGDKEHPEVKGIISYGKEIKVYENLEVLRNSSLDKGGRYYFLTQTTFNKYVFNEIKEYIKSNFLNSDIGLTICGATYERQIAIEKLAKETDVVIIVGGKNSSNTKKLYQISIKLNPNTYLVETKEDLNMDWFEKVNKVGISAGASTPEKSIIEIERKIKGDVQ